MTNKTLRAFGGAVLAAMAGLMLVACTTVVRQPATSTVVVKERAAPDVVVVPN